MIKAVIFDCFGVLVAEGWLSFKERYLAHDPKAFAEASELNQQADAGLLSRQDFIEQVARLAKVDSSKVVVALTSNAPNEPLFNYIQQLKTDYKIGLLSNASANRLDTLFAPEQLGLFDATVLSVESGLIKPHPAAYEKIAEELGVTVDEAIFIDDQERHCTGARKAGMRAIRYQNFNQLKTKLDELLGRS